ncbi:hypothetical protein AAC387_Pa05g0495 [Persea americana]
MASCSLSLSYNITSNAGKLLLFFSLLVSLLFLFLNCWPSRSNINFLQVFSHRGIIYKIGRHRKKKVTWRPLLSRSPTASHPMLERPRQRRNASAPGLSLPLILTCCFPLFSTNLPFSGLYLTSSSMFCFCCEWHLFDSCVL